MTETPVSSAPHAARSACLAAGLGPVVDEEDPVAGAYALALEEQLVVVAAVVPVRDPPDLGA